MRKFTGFIFGIVVLCGFATKALPGDWARAPMFSGSAAVVSASVANYISVSGNPSPVAVATEGNVLSVAPIAGVAKNLKCTTLAANGTVTAAGGTSYTFALDDGAATPTALTCVEGTAATSCSDTSHSVAIAAGDLLDIQITPAGTPTALEVKCSFEFDTIY